MEFFFCVELRKHWQRNWHALRGYPPLRAAGAVGGAGAVGHEAYHFTRPRKNLCLPGLFAHAGAVGRG